MSIQIVQHAVERSSILFVVKFFDLESNAVTPNDDITWSLYRPGGEYINGKESVSVSPPAEKVNIVLSGEDLPNGEVVLLVECTFNSTLGFNLPLRQEATFRVERTTK